MTDIITELHDRIRNECTEVDADKAYDDFLDECYSLKSVGGPFAHMCASKVLEECDPVAYRCGFSDWLDSEDLVDVGIDRDEYYWRSDCERERDRFIDELEAEADNAQAEIDELCADEDQTVTPEFHREHSDLLGQLQSVLDKIAELRKYIF